MSQDLFAAFSGSDLTAQSPQTSHPTSSSSTFFEALSKPEQDARQETADDDEWGDFEGAEAEERGFQTGIEKLTVNEVDFQAPVVREAPSEVDAGVSRMHNFSTQPLGSKPRDPNILFDADEDLPLEEEEEEDFGQFEGTPVAKPTPEPPTPRQEVDLLGLADSLPAKAPISVPQDATLPIQSGSMIDLEDLLGPSSPPEVIREAQNTTTKKGLSSKPIVQPSAATKSFLLKLSTPSAEKKQQKQQPAPDSKVVVQEEEDPWDEFTENIGEPSNTESYQTFIIPQAPPPPAEPPNAQPPTNIPPPAILLSLFPPLLTAISTAFFQPLSAQPAPARQPIYASAQTAAYLRAYLALATVCARVVAGRKARWKRDGHLAQAMRIGPATVAAARPGMKVAAVDRAEAQREDREVADVLRAWRAAVGRLRAAVADVKKAAERPADVEGLVVPEIRDVMPVKSVGTREGGVVGVRPCALCGLKREERVDKVDVDVFDGFGEWWVEDMNMHRGKRTPICACRISGSNSSCIACRNFWLEHEGKLRQR